MKKREGVALNGGKESEEKMLFSGESQDGAGLPVRSAVIVGSRSIWGSACAGISQC